MPSEKYAFIIKYNYYKLNINIIYYKLNINIIIMPLLKNNKATKKKVTSIF